MNLDALFKNINYFYKSAYNEFLTIIKIAGRVSLSGHALDRIKERTPTLEIRSKVIRERELLLQYLQNMCKDISFENLVKNNKLKIGDKFYYIYTQSNSDLTFAGYFQLYPDYVLNEFTFVDWPTGKLQMLNPEKDKKKLFPSGLSQINSGNFIPLFDSEPEKINAKKIKSFESIIKGKEDPTELTKSIDSTPKKLSVFKIPNKLGKILNIDDFSSDEKIYLNFQSILPENIEENIVNNIIIINNIMLPFNIDEIKNSSVFTLSISKELQDSDEMGQIISLFIDDKEISYDIFGKEAFKHVQKIKSLEEQKLKEKKNFQESKKIGFIFKINTNDKKDLKLLNDDFDSINPIEIVYKTAINSDHIPINALLQKYMKKYASNPEYAGVIIRILDDSLIEKLNRKNLKNVFDDLINNKDKFEVVRGTIPIWGKNIVASKKIDYFINKYSENLIDKYSIVLNNILE